MYENEFCEYAVNKKAEGAFLAKIIACAVIFALVCAVSFLFVIPSSPAAGVALIGATILVAWYLSRFSSIEYEYSVSGDYMDFAAIYSKQYRKEKLSVDLKKCARKVMPFNGTFGDFKVKSVLDLRSSAKISNSYVLIYDDGNGEKAVLFNATKKLVDNVFRRVPSLVVRDTNLPE